MVFSNKYPIYQYGKGFVYSDEPAILKGKRVKKLVKVHKENNAFIKYKASGYNTSELCSEKIAYELAKELSYDCARIEFAEDEKGEMGVLNFLFSNLPKLNHTDIVAYLNDSDVSAGNYEKFYTLSNIKNVLDGINSDLFPGFVRIMIFDALIGEQDRHEENWGILKDDKNATRISPLYDNGCSLLRDLIDDEKIKKIQSLEVYSNRSKTLFRKEAGTIKIGESKKYHHFELINQLAHDYPKIMKDELASITRLSDNNIRKIVNKVPDKMLTNLHKQYIIKYIILRKQKLIETHNRLCKKVN